jgi:hypothetical protein
MVTLGSSYAWQARYTAAVRGTRWRNMKQDMIRLRGGRCERCGYQHGLELHHRNYDRLGRELISDLELVCHRCHQEADRERARQGQARTEEARYNTALDTYATKKYGEAWEDWLERDEVAEEFDQWLKRKQCE